DLGFTVSTGQTTGGSLTGSAGMERTIASNGTFTDGPIVATGWELDNGQGFPFRVHVLGTGVGPAHTIIGKPDGSNVYSNANGGIAGNGPHNPFLANTVVFDVAITGLPSTAFVSSALFSFGTTEGQNIVVNGGGPGGGGRVPEPGTIGLLVGMGVSGSVFALL